MTPRGVVALVAVAGCVDGGEREPVDTSSAHDTGEASPVATDVLVVATQNAGTTPFLDLIESSDLRDVCEAHYSNNLCTLDAEEALRDALSAERPHVVFLQEMWDRTGCDDADRPGEAQRAPFVCSATGSQLVRVLPGSMSWACGTAYPDNCIAWDPARFAPGGACDGRDCSAAMTDLTFDCSQEGRIALVDGTLDGAPATLVVAHTNAGPSDDDQACRAEQLGIVQAALEARADRVWLLGGDVNHDPAVGTGADAQAFATLLAATGAVRWPDDGDTSRLLPSDLDVVVAKGLARDASCAVRFVDEDRSPVMFDHALVVCR